ncbi:MAG: transglycosylase domain-containing protein, partial [Anaerotignum sp.]|nr:transglycosylase domain-containing protein [Anaerotignum sp.]
MENNSRKKKHAKRQRQDWNPHWSLKILYGLWMTVLAAAKIALGAVATVLMIVLVCGFVFVGILGEYLEKDVLPESANYEFNVSDLEQTSNMYYVDSSGNIQLLQELHTVYDREWVEYEDIPENLINAAIAIEDKRFYEHQGVDWITTVKACINMFMGGDSQFGGSTITQQLIKNTLLSSEQSYKRKIQEAYLALQLETRYSKDEILETYLNTIYQGE